MAKGAPNPASWGCTPTLVSACTTQHIPAYITGKINKHPTQLLLDSGASCSVISKKHINIDKLSPENSIQLINADGRSFMPLGTSSATVTLGEFSASHTFLVVEELVQAWLCSRHPRGCGIPIRHPTQNKPRYSSS